jgi:hypothetical protein
VSRRALRPLLRAAAVVVGATLPLLGSGVARADLPGGIPPPPGLPQSGQPITMVVQPPSVFTVAVPPPPTGCAIDASYDNTGTTPPGTVFRGQTGCGAGVYAPVLTGHAVLLDVFGNVVASGGGYGQVGGVGTSQGRYALQGSLTSGLNGAGPVPGLDYTIRYDTSITLRAPQYWGPPAAGCSVSGQTLYCTVSTTYSYIPGTQGGLTPG